MSEFRRNPIFGNWIIIDTERNYGREKIVNDGNFAHQDNTHCPFCSGNEHMTKPEILAFSDNPYRAPNTSGWKLRVIPNNKPILQIESKIKRQAYGIYDRMEGAGAHEIIIGTPEHNLKFQDASVEYYENIYRAAISRIRDLRNDMRFEYIYYMKKYGYLAYPIHAHQHSQIIALPIIPKQVNEEIDGAARYFNYKDRCIFCDIILQELDEQVRLIAENDFFIAVCPYASRFPFEMWIMPKEHSGDFDSISNAEILSLSKIAESVYLKYALLLGDCPFSVIMHTAPLKKRNMPHYHWYIEIIPDITVSGGIDRGTGLFVNPIFPEEAAKNIRG
jgi:UDPglucose--hexose-1-phosphate uridylyltransferase